MAVIAVPAHRAAVGVLAVRAVARRPVAVVGVLAPGGAAQRGVVAAAGAVALANLVLIAKAEKKPQRAQRRPV